MKKTKLISVISLALCMLLLSFPACSESSTVYDYYLLEDGTAEIAGCRNYPESLEIPTELNGITVTSIGAGAFRDCFKLTDVVIPDTVTAIDDLAFWNCYQMTEITIPESVTKIGEGAFRECSSLTDIVIPDTVAAMGDGVFAFCHQLNNIMLPENMRAIGTSMFYECRSLQTLAIPESVTAIGERAFYNCSGLAEIVIPGNVTSIGNSAFAFCTHLANVTIPDSVTSIEEEAFYYCPSDIVFTVGPGSYAEQYCIENRYHYQYSDGTAPETTDILPAGNETVLEGTWIISGVKADNPDDAELRYMEMMDELLSSGDFAETYTFEKGMMIHTVKNRDSQGEWITTAEYSAPYRIDEDKIITTNAMGYEGSKEFRVTGNILELINKDDITVLTRVE